MSAIAAAAAHPSSSISIQVQVEELLTHCVRGKGREIPDTDTRKQVVNLVHRVRVNSWEAGILTIDFGGIGNNRYHWISKQKQSNEWRVLKGGRVDPVAAEQIAAEVLERIGEKMLALHKTKIHPHMNTQLQHVQQQDHEPLTALLQCPIKETYLIDNETARVFVYRGTPTDAQKEQFYLTLFGPEAVWTLQFTNQLHAFAMLFRITPENPLRPILISEDNRQKAIDFHRSLHEKLAHPSNVELAREIYKHLSIPIPLQDGSIRAIPLTDIIIPQLIKSQLSLD